MSVNPFSDLKTSDPFNMSVHIKDVDLSIVNSLRRVVLSEIPNVGFLFDPHDMSEESKDIDVLQNDTPLHNEIIQHRISLIPINVNVEELENWDSKELRFEINKSNNSGNLLSVYSSDFVVYDSKNNVRNELAKRFFPPDPISKQHILITKIKAMENSRFHIVARAVTNVPKNYASFGLVSNCSVEFVVDEKVAAKQLQMYLEQNASKDTKENLEHKFNSIERERHYVRNAYREPNHFIFKIVSECKIPCEYIFKQAINILKSKVIAFQNSDYDVLNINGLFSIVITNETHTLGNLFQSLCFNHYIRDNLDNDNFSLQYIGYNVPHPLEKVLLIKVRGDKLIDVDTVRDFVNHATDYIYKMLTKLETHWNNLSNK